MRKKLLSFLLTLIIIVTFGVTAYANESPGKITKEDMIYFLMTDRFYDGDKTNDQDVIPGSLSSYQGGDFQGIIDKLDYIKSLGFTVIWISPVVENQAGGYHGYWAYDFYKTNEHFGTMDKLKELVSKAHQKGLKVIVDLVVNHTGQLDPWVNDPKYADWYHEYSDINDYNEQTQVENGWLAGLPDLNQENPEVKSYLISMAKWWIKETGIDGYRLDTVKHVPKDFWQDFSKAIKKDYPDFYLLGEVYSGDTDYVADYQNYGIDGLLDFPSYYAINDVFKDDKIASKLSDIIIKEGSSYKDRSLMGTFIDNHDVPRFESQIYTLKSERLESALTFMMTYTGIPVMYYGTEIGMEGGSDPDNRRNMEFDAKSPITDYVKKLTSIRKENKALTSGDIQVVKSEDNFLCYSRTYENNIIITAFNTLDKEQKLNFNLPDKLNIKSGYLKNLITLKSTKIKGGKITLNMSPMEAGIFVLNKGSVSNNYVLYIIFGAVIILILVIFIYIKKRSKLIKKA